jgi:hypothetical protein
MVTGRTRDDIEYRIAHLRAAILHIDALEDSKEDWEDGYRCGSLFRMESELRFLEQIYKRST